MRYNIRTTKLMAAMEALKAVRLGEKQFAIPTDSVGEYPRFHIIIKKQNKGESNVDIHIDMYRHNFAVSTHHLISELYQTIKNQIYVAG